MNQMNFKRREDVSYFWDLEVQLKEEGYSWSYKLTEIGDDENAYTVMDNVLGGTASITYGEMKARVLTRTAAIRECYHKLRARRAMSPEFQTLAEQAVACADKEFEREPDRGCHPEMVRSHLMVLLEQIPSRDHVDRILPLVRLRYRQRQAARRWFFAYGRLGSDRLSEVRAFPSRRSRDQWVEEVGGLPLLKREVTGYIPGEPRKFHRDRYVIDMAWDYDESHRHYYVEMRREEYLSHYVRSLY